jgi:hypothetical protein
MSAIAGFRFVRMDPMPAGPQEQIILEARAGVTGITAWKGGRKGRPLQLTTIADTPSGQGAANLVLAYQQLVGAGLVPIFYAGSQLPFGVLVLSVEPVEISETLLGVGGLNGLSRGLCVARWEVLPWS